ncbi:endo-1,3-alpha-glucanase family glycosylhydrolase [Pendulispora albinea]|uniref:Glycosyl hydrolase family 71 n=1 Tax=Pendulispora albinea TaxID=2741071 RepID=A0ABZ2LYG2_9BACT
MKSPWFIRPNFGLVGLFVASALSVSACSSSSSSELESAEPGATPGADSESPELGGETLPFDMPARTELAKSEYKVFAHWHDYPLRYYDNLGGGQYTDHYGKWLQPAGDFASVGGRLRDRPVPLLPVPATEPDYGKRDMKTDITTAAAAGIDGFLFNYWFPPSDRRWKKLADLFDAADEFDLANPSAPFYVIPNIDSHILASNSGKNEPRLRADQLAAFKDRASWRKLNGKYVVGSYRPEALPASWYQQFFDQLEKVHGIRAVLWGTLLDPSAANCNALKPFMAGATFSRWDNLPYTNDGRAGLAQLKSWGDANGVPYSPPVSHTDNRPADSISTETAGFKSQYNSWTAAIDSGVKMVQILTWNDHGEGHALRPNTATQYAFYDLTAYYATWFKTRRKPAIVRDVLYYAHRMHKSTERPDPQKQPAITASKNNVPFVDRVFVLGMLKSAGRIQITSGGVASKADVAAGLQFVEAPLAANDRPQFQLSRSGAVVTSFSSAFSTRAPIVWQDLLYRAGSSARPAVAGVGNSLPQDRAP